MSKYEKAELTNMCMIYDGAGRVVVQDKVGKNWGGITFPGGHVEKDEIFSLPNCAGSNGGKQVTAGATLSCCSKPTATPARCMILTKAKCFGPN